jgi:hypothetical protein
MVTFKNNSKNSEKKSNLAKLLATENLDVQFRRAKTASFNMEDRILTIPIYKEELDKDALDMFIAHECSHAINTPVSGWEKASKTKIPLDIFNIVEDARIDKMIKNKYPGIVNNYRNGAKWLWKNNFFKNRGKKFSDYNIVDKFNLYFKTNELDKFSEKNFTNQEFKLITEGENLKTWGDVVELSEKLYKEFKKENSDKKTQSKSDLKAFSLKGGEKSDGSGQQIKDSDNSKESDDDRISKTLSALEGGMSLKTDTEASDSIYVNLPKPNLKNIIVTPKEFVKEMEKKASEIIHKTRDEDISEKVGEDDATDVYTNEMKKKYNMYHTSFNRFKKKSNKTVNYLVKEFEMRKQARQYKRAKTDKTGIIDPMKLHTYKFNEDLFKRLVELPEDKNHGMIFLLDWSSSMSDTLFKTTKQLMNLIWFCDKVQIPFEVYAFRDINNDWGDRKEGSKYLNSKYWDFKENDLAMNDFELINVLSHRSTKQEFKKCMYHLYFLAEHLNCGYGYYRYADSGSKPEGFSEEFSLDELEKNKELIDFGYISTPERFGLTTTPLVEALVAMQDLVPAFRKKYRVDKLSFVTLTDGGANGPWSKVLRYNKELKDLEKVPHRNMEEEGGYLVNYHYIVKDRKTKKRFSLPYNKTTDEKRLRSVDANFVGVLLKMLKEQWATTNLGFFIVPKRATYIIENWTDYRDQDKEKRNLRKTGNAIVKEPGYDDYYLLFAPKLNTDNRDLSELDDLKDKEGNKVALTKSKIKSVFRNSCSGKVKSRVILNKFIEKVA